MGSKVRWKWRNGFARGKVKEVFHRIVSKTINGSKVIMNGSKDCPVFLIKKEGESSEILLLQSDVQELA
tara:strand:+ start:19942 stop:20148 length:207 start_codon:yes stop_codon:yes gene_type:complete